jgi:hypothetical protein
MREDEHEPRTTRRGFAKQLAAFFAVGTGIALAGAQNAWAAGGYCICDDGSHGCRAGTKVCFDNCNHTRCCTGQSCPPPAYGVQEIHTDCPCGG